MADKRTSNTRGDKRMLVTTDAMQCVRVSVAEVRCSKTQLVRSCQRARPLQLCRETYNCSAEDCPFAHPASAEVYATWTFRRVHANLVYRNFEEVRYRRHLGEGTVRELCPNNAVALSDDCPINMFLFTKGTADIKPGDDVTHCAHFYYEKACNLGEYCSFAHMISIHAYTACPKMPDRLQWVEKRIIKTDGKTGEIIKVAVKNKKGAKLATDDAVMNEKQSLNSSQSEHWRVYDAPSPSDSTSVAPVAEPRTVWTKDSTDALACVQVPASYDPPNNPRPACENVEVSVDVGDDGVAHVIVTEVTKDRQAPKPPKPVVAPPPPAAIAPVPAHLMPRVGVAVPAAARPAAPAPVAARAPAPVVPAPVAPRVKVPQPVAAKTAKVRLPMYALPSFPSVSPPTTPR